MKGMMKTRIWTWLLGLGLVFFAWNTPLQPFRRYIGLPYVGIVLMVVACWFLYNHNRAKISLGSKTVWIPLAIIALSIAGSGIAGVFRGDITLFRAMGIFYAAILFFALYPISRFTGPAVFTPIIWASLIESFSIVVWAATHHWATNGGLLHPYNYNIATGLCLFGAIVASSKWRWWLIILATVCLFFSGSAEAIFLLTVICIVSLFNRLERKYVLALTVVVIVVVGIGLMIGANSSLWDTNLVARIQALTHDNLSVASGYRIGGTWALGSILPLGHGYLVDGYIETPHNVILAIIQQVGPLAALAWLYIAIQGIRVDRFVWIVFVAMGVFDMFIWTQAAPWFWVLAGVTFRGDIKDG